MKLLSKYYSRQAAKGVGPSTATALLPVKAFNQVAALVLGRERRAPRRNTVNGFGLYHLPLLAGYSRSGTNWVRYIIERITNRPTPGQTRFVSGDNYIVDRAHCAYPVMHLHQGVILILRDYRECLLRQHRGAWPHYNNVFKFLSDDRLRQPCEWYIQNIAAFDNLKENKLVLYYEDLVGDPEKQILRLAKFLDFDRDGTRAFLDNTEQMFKESISAYTSVGHESMTGGVDRTYHARSMLSLEQTRQFDDYFFDGFPEISRKYLSRYDTR